MPPRAGPASHLHFSSLLLTESRTAAHSLLRKSCMCFPHSACWVCSHQPVPMTSTSPMLPLFPHFQIIQSIAYFTRENALGFGSIFRSNSVLRSRPGTYNQSQTPAVIKTEATASVPSQDTKLKLVQDLRSQTTLYCPVVNKYTCKVYGQHLINIGIQLLCITRYKITGTGKKNPKHTSNNKKNDRTDSWQASRRKEVFRLPIDIPDEKHTKEDSIH